MKFLKDTLFVLFFAVLSLSTRAQVGNPAPNFTVTDTHGDTHTLYDFLDSGKVVVLDFFYTTCGPCQFYSPQVNLAYEKYGCNTANVIFMAIDYNDTNAEVMAYDQQYGIEYPSVSGLNGGGNAVVAQYGILGFPTFYVIDSSKTIVQQIDPPTLQVFDFRFQEIGIVPAECIVGTADKTALTERLDLFPNPVAGETLNLRLPENAAGMVNFEIMDPAGRFVRSGQLVSNERKMYVGDLPPGVFLLKINALNEGKTYAGLFVKG